MTKRLQLTYVHEGITCVAELLEKEAPVTCAAIWAGLEFPMRALGMHAKWVGNEVMLNMPPENRRFDGRAVPPENQTCFPIPGDLMWFYFPAGAWPGSGNEIYEFGIIYGRDTRMLIPIGWVPGNVFGRIVENFDEFAAACSRVHREGFKDMAVRRLEG